MLMASFPSQRDRCRRSYGIIGRLDWAMPTSASIPMKQSVPDTIPERQRRRRRDHAIMTGESYATRRTGGGETGPFPVTACP